MGWVLLRVMDRKGYMSYGRSMFRGSKYFAGTIPRAHAPFHIRSPLYMYRCFHGGSSRDAGEIQSFDRGRTHLYMVGW